MVCVEENLVREAYESMKKAVELDPDNPLVNYAMGAVSTHRHEPSESLPYMREIRQAQARRSSRLFRARHARFYSNQFDEAKPELERATRALKPPPARITFWGALPGSQTICLWPARSSVPSSSTPAWPTRGRNSG